MHSALCTALLLLPIPCQPYPQGNQRQPNQYPGQQYSSSNQTQPHPVQEYPPSYLYEPSFEFDNVLRPPARPYVPQPGDIMLATDKNLFWTVTHNLAWAGEPHNSAVIVRDYDGHLVVLEAGPDDTFWVGKNEMLSHLKHYSDKGPVWIRRRKVPATEDQSQRMTEFGMRQVGKRFALIRMGAQMTPIRTRGPLRTWFMGGPSGDRSSYFCSELVTETLVAGGLLDGATARPSATYPHDLFFEHSYNLYLRAHFHLDDWYPPARWVPAP